MRSSSTPTVVSCGEHSYLRFLRHKTHIRPQSLHTRTRLLSSKNCSTTFFELLLLYTPSLIRAFLLFRQLFLGPHPFAFFPFLIILAIYFVISLVISIIVCVCLVAGSKGKQSVSFKNYLTNKSRLVNKSDIYIRTDVKRVKRESSSSGGGRSSGGHSHGGGGHGHF